MFFLVQKSKLPSEMIILMWVRNNHRSPSPRAVRSGRSTCRAPSLFFPWPRPPQPRASPLHAASAGDFLIIYLSCNRINSYCCGGIRGLWFYSKKLVLDAYSERLFCQTGRMLFFNSSEFRSRQGWASCFVPGAGWSFHPWAVPYLAKG